MNLRSAIVAATLACALSAAVPAAARAQGSAAEHVAAGDRDRAANPAAALKHYEAALAADPNSYDALWRASVAAIDLGEVNGGSGGFQEFDGASSGLITQEDLEEAAGVLAPGTSAAVLVWENRWAAPVAVALRRSGGQLVASGRIHLQALLAALEETELASPSTS